MPTLNRFPLLGLWAKEVARRLGYTKGEAESLGHAYAVLYAIRASSRPHKKASEVVAPSPDATAPAAPPGPELLAFGGDRLEIARVEQNRVRGRVGGGSQTPESYRAHIEAKFPGDYCSKLEEAFRRVLQKYPPKKLNSRFTYELYDQWKKLCGAGRLVDLDKLLAWCSDRTKAVTK